MKWYLSNPNVDVLLYVLLHKIVSLFVLDVQCNVHYVVQCG